MTGSLMPLLAYAALLVAALLAPYLSLCFAEARARWMTPAWITLCALLLTGVVLLTLARDGGVPLICAFLLLPLAGLGTGALLGGITAALLFVTAAWWTADLQLSAVPGSIFVALALAAGLLSRWTAPTHGEVRLPVAMLLCAIIGLMAGLLTGPFEALEPIQSTWHHWSAYLSPVESWRAGFVPYRDFPIQYGLGPTALLRAACGTDCWSGMYAVVIIANALYFATLAGCALLLTAGTSRGVRWLTLVALFCASFVWTGYPVHFAGPAMTPSVAGLRFLGISSLLLHILLAEQRKVRRDWVGHFLWLASLFWSSEAALFATLIWWPYLAIRDASEATGTRAAVIALAWGTLRAVVALATGVCAVALTLWLLSDGTIRLVDFFAYVQHPPGARMAEPLGAIWIALVPVALSLALLARRGLSPEARPLYVCLLGFVASGTYYMSRSHDNNILNLFPLLILLLVAILGRGTRRGAASPGFAGGFVRATLLAIVAFVVTFNFAPWKEGLSKGGLIVGPARLLSRLTPHHGDSPALLSADGVEGLEYLRARQAGMVVLFDGRNVIPRMPGATATAWTPVNSIANFSPLPPPMIADYIRRGAAASRRPGWILADASHRSWVDAFRTAYNVREQKSFGSYTAYYMVPRL